MLSFRVLVVTLLMLTIVTLNTHTPAVGVEPFLVSQVGGQVQAIDTDGRFAYVGHGARVVVMDVTEVGHPHEIAHSSTLPGSVNHLAVAGNFLYVAHSRGLTIVDVSDPLAPRPRGSYQQAGGLSQVVLLGHYAYGFATGVSHDFDHIIDVANPDWPVAGRELDGYRPIHDMAILGRYGYAVSSQFLNVFDLAIPANPIMMIGYGLGEDSRCAAGAKGILYLCSESNDLRMFTVDDDPTSVVPADIIPLAAPPVDLTIKDDIAYVITTESLVILDLAQSPPQQRLEIPILAPQALALVGEWVYVVGASGLWALPAAGPTPGRAVFRIDMLSAVDEVLLRGSLAYVASGIAGVGVLDINRPDAPRVLGLAAMDGQRATRLALDHESLYAINGGGPRVEDDGQLAVFNISDPTRPVLKSVLSLPAPVFDVAAASGYVFAAAGEAGVLVIDARDEGRPVVVAQVGRGHWQVKSIARFGWHVLVADVKAGLRVLDFAVPSAPRELALLPYFTQFHTRGLAVSGSLLYLPGYEQPIAPGLEQLPEDVLVIELNDPAHPRLRGSIGLTVGPFDLAAGAGRLVLADAPVFNHFDGPERRLTVKSLTNPLGSGPLGMIDLPDTPAGVELSGDLAYVAVGGAGLFVVRVGDPDLFLPTSTPTKRTTVTRPPLRTATPPPTATPRGTTPRLTPVATRTATATGTEPSSRLALPRVVR